MLIAPAGEWRALADHLETGKVKSKAEFLTNAARRQRVVEHIRARCDGRIDTAQVGISPGWSSSVETWHGKGSVWDGSEERSLATEAKHQKLTGFRLPDYWKRDCLDVDTLEPLHLLKDKLGEDQKFLAGCFQRVCFALDPTDKEGGAGGGIDDYAGEEEVLRLLADAHRLAIDLQDLGAHIYERACERGL